MSSENNILGQPILILILIFVGGGAIVIFFQVRGLIWAKTSVDWPVARGKVISSSVKMSSSSKSGTSFEAKVNYEFTVEGDTFEGDRIFFGKTSSGNSSDEDQIAWSYPKGKSVNVYYRPGNPEVCLLEPGKTGKSKLLLIFGVIFFSAGMFLVLTRKMWYF